MQTKIRPASSDDIESILEIENSTNLMPWTKAQFISSMEVGSRKRRRRYGAFEPFSFECANFVSSVQFSSVA